MDHRTTGNLLLLSSLGEGLLVRDEGISGGPGRCRSNGERDGTTRRVQLLTSWIISTNASPGQKGGNRWRARVRRRSGRQQDGNTSGPEGTNPHLQIGKIAAAAARTQSSSSSSQKLAKMRSGPLRPATAALPGIGHDSLEDLQHHGIRLELQISLEILGSNTSGPPGGDKSSPPRTNVAALTSMEGKNILTSGSGNPSRTSGRRDLSLIHI